MTSPVPGEAPCPTCGRHYPFVNVILTQPEQTTPAQIVTWLRSLFEKSKLHAHIYQDGTVGLIGVPMKYCRVLDAMAAAMLNLATGQPLPAFTMVPIEPTESTKP